MASTRSTHTVELGTKIGTEIDEYAMERSLTLTAMVRLILAEWIIKKNKRAKGYKKSTDNDDD